MTVNIYFYIHNMLTGESIYENRFEIGSAVLDMQCLLGFFWMPHNIQFMGPFGGMSGLKGEMGGWV